MKNYLIGISGSVSAYKSISLIREISKLGATCKVVITQGGLNFIQPQLISSLGFEVFTDDTLDLSKTDTAMAHINLAKWADEILLAPCSANLIAKIAHGFADDLLTQILLVAKNKRKIIAPAMNINMWTNKVTQQNIQILQSLGYELIEPDSGELACGDVGTGRLPEINNILGYLVGHIPHNKSLLTGKTIIISLGATIEDIDGVRYLSNYSSGKMGLALIKQALNSGAKVIAVAARIAVELPTNTNLEIIHVTSAQNMLETIEKYAKSADIFISCAAVSDYRIKQAFNHKIKKENNSLTLEFVKNPDILDYCSKNFPKLICVGFALETQNLITYAKEKLKSKNLALIVANKINTLGKDLSEVIMIDKFGSQQQINQESKDNIAYHIILKIIDIFKNSHST